MLPILHLESSHAISQGKNRSDLGDLEILLKVDSQETVRKLDLRSDFGVLTRRYPLQNEAILVISEV